MKTKILSLTKKDFEIQTFCSGGKGGQNQNKVASGVRIIHLESGAVGEARDSRDQYHNKQNAFNRMFESKRFQGWLKIETARRLGTIPTEKELNKMVDEDMKDDNLKIEFFTP